MRKIKPKDLINNKEQLDILKSYRWISNPFKDYKNLANEYPDILASIKNKRLTINGNEYEVSNIRIKDIYQEVESQDTYTCVLSDGNEFDIRKDAFLLLLASSNTILENNKLNL